MYGMFKNHLTLYQCRVLSFLMKSYSTTYSVQKHNTGRLTKETWLREATLYVHWPYCEKMCTFCNFNKYMSKNVDHSRMEECLLRETETLLRMSGVKKVKSIFFGGGTPSLASPSTLAAIIRKVKECAYMEDDAEVTVECNPTRQTSEKLSDFKEAGINRISCGIQSFNNEALRLLGRNHSAEDSLRFLACAKRHFSGCTSIDLLFGRPHQTADDWKKELQISTSLCDSHVSLYQLTVEKGTRLSQQVQRGELTMPSSETLATMYEIAIEELEGCGLQQYEVANFAKEGAESKHNMAYWNGTQYIGVGPGAHGRFVCSGIGQKERCARVQVSEPNFWMKEVERRGHATEKTVVQSTREVLEELLMTSMRTVQGISNERWCLLSQGCTLTEIFSGHLALDELVDNGYIEWDAMYLRPTKKGLPVADSLTLSLLPAMDVIWQCS